MLVVAPNRSDERLLEHIDDVRRTGGRVLTLNREDPELARLAHEMLVVPDGLPNHTLEEVQQVVSVKVLMTRCRVRRRLGRSAA